MRVLFCGSGRCAVPSLSAVLAGGHDVVGVVTQPARPAGRGSRLRPTRLAELAGEAALPVHELEDINAEGSPEVIRSLRPDVICVVDFGQFIGRHVRELAPLGAFNMHASLLPALRGAAPVNWAIIRGYRRTGATTFALADRMDAGPVYLQEATDIAPDETAEELLARVAAIGAGLVCRTLDLLAAGAAEPRPQDESKATLAPRLKKSDGLIEWSGSASDVSNLVRGTWPWPGGHAVFRRQDGREMPVILARAAAEDNGQAGEPGRVDADLLVGAGKGRVRIEQIKPAGKRLMSWRDFVNGYRVSEGDCFIRMEAQHDGQ